MTTQQIASHLGISLRKAAIVLALIRGQLDPLSYPSHFPETDTWVHQCHYLPRQSERVLSALNELLEMHGVEGLRIEGEHVDNHYYDIVATYLNTGDSYAPTILLDHERNKWRLTSCGDFVEAREQRVEEEASEA